MKSIIDWKNNDKNYIFYLQKFLDECDNIKDEDIKSRIIHSMLRCDERLTNLALREIEKMNKEVNK